MSNSIMHKKTAFSLIELSIVILVIGIIIAGVTQSHRMVKVYQLKTAEQITQSSPVHSISDLMLWYEAASQNSFIDYEAQDQSLISSWIDINSQSTIKKNATQNDDAQKPKYIRNCINNLPCLRFIPNQGFLSFDGSGLVGSSYSVVVVEQRRSSSGGFFIAGTNGVTNGLLHLGYTGDTTIAFKQYSNDQEATVDSYVGTIPKIHVFQLDKGNAKTYYINGIAQTLTGSGNADPLISYDGAIIGRYGSVSFDGDIAEIIIFAKSLKIPERRDIEKYLARKWKITIS